MRTPLQNLRTHALTKCFPSTLCMARSKLIGRYFQGVESLCCRHICWTVCTDRKLYSAVVFIQYIHCKNPTLVSKPIPHSILWGFSLTTSLPLGVYPESIEWCIEDQVFSMICLLPQPLPPSPAIKLSLFLGLPMCPPLRFAYWRKRGEEYERRAKSYDGKKVIPSINHPIFSVVPFVRGVFSVVQWHSLEWTKFYIPSKKYYSRSQRKWHKIMHTLHRCGTTLTWRGTTRTLAGFEPSACHTRRSGDQTLSSTTSKFMWLRNSKYLYIFSYSGIE